MYGAANTTTIAIRTICTTARLESRARDRRRGARSWTSRGSRSPAAVLVIVHPLLGVPKLDPGDQDHDDEEHPGECRRIAHPEVPEADIEEVVHIEQGGVHRSAARCHVRLGEDLEAGD